MGGENQSYDDIELKENDGSVEWDFMENGNGVCSSDSESIESTLDEDYSTFLLSCSASQVTVEEDDASSSSSSSTSSSSPTSSGPLYELSELMDQLPIKRGLSNYYQGKSQSFTSLASVKRVEDLAKKASRPYRKREKPASCKKYSPKAIITKKSCSRDLVLYLHWEKIEAVVLLLLLLLLILVGLLFLLYKSTYSDNVQIN